MDFFNQKQIVFKLERILFYILSIGIFVTSKSLQTSANPNYADSVYTRNYNTQQNESFDFIVIGSGPSGAVIANRLSEVPEWNVLLLEAGEETTILSDIPAVAGWIGFTDLNWGYKAERQSGFCQGGVEALAYIKTNESTDSTSSSPDLELIFVGGGISSDGGAVFRRMFNIPQETYDIVWKPQVYPMWLHPQSYGYMKLKSKNPLKWPQFYANYLSDLDDQDIRTLIAAIREIQRINESPSFQRYGATLVSTPIPGCENQIFDSDDYWECSLRQLIGSLHHQVGACKMGQEHDPEAVVDHKLRVHGIGNLRVADTSIIPLTLAAHTATPSYMIGEKAADIIKEEWMSNSFA